MSAQPQNARTLKLGTSRLADNRVGFSVADTGGGIASGNEEKIFEPYYTTKPLGLGLGLSLSRSIIAAHGGRLWAENPPAGGATFHFDIPEWTVERDPLGTPADPLFQHDMGENENSAAALGSIAP